MNYLDNVFLIVILVLACISAIKGFLKELMGTLGLIVSFFISYNASPMLSAYIFNIVGIIFLANLISYIVLFLISMLIMHYILLSIFGKVNINKVLDIFLGFVLGGAKGFIFLYMFFILLDIIMSSNNQPILIQKSGLRELMYSSNISDSFLIDKSINYIKEKN